MYKYPYPRAANTTDAIVFAKENNNTKILLIQRAREPFQLKWALPGGFIDMEETLVEACKRELEEETGLKVDKLIQFKTYDAIDRDPRHRTISTVFYTQLPSIVPVAGADDASQAEWFSVDKLPELAFDHQQIIDEFKLQVLSRI